MGPNFYYIGGNPSFGSNLLHIRINEPNLIYALSSITAISGPFAGSVLYCSDCKNPHDSGYSAGTCTGGGSGNLARRIAGAWHC